MEQEREERTEQSRRRREESRAEKEEKRRNASRDGHMGLVCPWGPDLAVLNKDP